MLRFHRPSLAAIYLTCTYLLCIKQRKKNGKVTSEARFIWKKAVKTEVIAVVVVVVVVVVVIVLIFLLLYH